MSVQAEMSEVELCSMKGCTNVTETKRRGRGKAYQHYHYELSEYDDNKILINNKRYICSSDVIKDYPCIKNRKQLSRIYNNPRQDKKNSHLVVKQIKEPVYEKVKINYD